MFEATKNFYQQRLNEKTREVISENLKSEVQKKFSLKSFSERYYSLYQSSKFFQWVFQLTSLTTSFVALYYLLPDFFIILKIPLILLIIGTFEVKVKRPIVQTTCKTWFDPNYDFEFFSISISMLVISLSAALSIYGAMEMVPIFVPSVENINPVLLEKNLVNDYYDKKVNKIEMEKVSYEKKRMYKGRLRTEDISVISDYANQVKELEAERQKELKALVDSNKIIVAKNLVYNQNQQALLKKEREVWKQSFISGSFLAELLFILCIFFEWWYLIRCKMELPELDLAPDPFYKKSKKQVLLNKITSLDDTSINDLLKELNVNVNANANAAKKSKSMQIPQGGKKGICKECKKEFTITRAGHVFCQTACRVSYWKNRNV